MKREIITAAIKGILESQEAEPVCDAGLYEVSTDMWRERIDEEQSLGQLGNKGYRGGLDAWLVWAAAETQVATPGELIRLAAVGVAELTPDQAAALFSDDSPEQGSRVWGVRKLLGLIEADDKLQAVRAYAEFL